MHNTNNQDYQDSNDIEEVLLCIKENIEFFLYNNPALISNLSLGYETRDGFVAGDSSFAKEILSTNTGKITLSEIKSIDKSVIDDWYSVNQCRRDYPFRPSI